MLLSQHTAQTNRFLLAGGQQAWGLAAPGSIALLRYRVSLVGLAARPCMRLVARKGGPPIRPGSDVRTLSLVGLISGDRPHVPVLGGSTPPSFDVVAFGGYDAVAFRPLKPCMPTARARNNEFDSPGARRRRAAFGSGIDAAQRCAYPGSHPWTHPGTHPRMHPGVHPGLASRSRR